VAMPNDQVNRPCRRAPKDARRTRSGLNAWLGMSITDNPDLHYHALVIESDHQPLTVNA
jgi:hypothetical protein